jgi:hypothetical protein
MPPVTKKMISKITDQEERQVSSKNLMKNMRGLHFNRETQNRSPPKPTSPTQPSVTSEEDKKVIMHQSP